MTLEELTQTLRMAAVNENTITAMTSAYNLGVEELEQENRLLRARNERLEAEVKALAQQEQEPVAWIEQGFYDDGTPHPCHSIKWAGRKAEDDFPIGTKFYTTPPQPEPVVYAKHLIADLVKEEMRHYFAGHYIDSSDAKYQLRSFANKIANAFTATTPPQRKPLSDEQKKNIFLKFYGKHWAYTNQIKHVMQAVEAAHGIKE